MTAVDRVPWLVSHIPKRIPVPKFCANLSMLFTEHDFLDRFAAAAEAGFTGVEFHFPYEVEAGRLVGRLGAAGLTQVLFNLPPGDWAAGERGIACLPDRVGEFQDGVGRAIGYATALGCRNVNCLAGIRPDSLDPDAATATLVENLGFAAAKMAEAGIRLLLEPINTRDMPGFFVSDTADALALFEGVASDNLYLQYDCYHMQIMQGDLAPTFAALKDRIAHIQIADTPGRHEPGTGEINHPFLFDWFDAQGYEGWVGAEYWPRTTTAEGLGWFRPYRVGG